MIVVAGALSAAGILLYGILSGGFTGPHSDWRELVREYEAASEPVYFDAVIPPALPDEQNFFASPVFDAITHPAHGNSGSPGLLDRALHPGQGISVAALLSAASGELGKASLDGAARSMLAAGVTNPKTDYLLPGDRVMAGIRALKIDFSPLAGAAGLPGSRFPIDYGKIPSPDLPHLPYLEALGDWLAVQAIAEISIGDSGKAAADLLLIWRLADSVTSEPFLASQQTRRKLLDLFAACLRAGIPGQTWTAEELDTFGSVLEHNRILTDFAWALRGERAQINTVVHHALSGKQPPASQEIQTWLGPDVAELDLHGLRKRQVAANRVIQHLLGQLNDSAKIDEFSLRAPEEDSLPETAAEHLESIRNEAAAFARTQVTLAQARIACALERYRLERGDYPEELDSLVPEFLDSTPLDPMSRSPMAYRRLSGKSYELTSRSWQAGTEPEAQPWTWNQTAN